MCVTEDGLVFACGKNERGQLGVAGTENIPMAMLESILGIGDADDRLVPTLVAGQLQGCITQKPAVSVAAGYNHTCCITADGSLFAWGFNNRGQLGVGDTKNRRMPTPVTGFQGRQVVHVAAGGYHTICATADGSMFTWGGGKDGILGLGEWSNRRVPTMVRGELRDKAVVQVAAGFEHSACVTADGLVYAWGNNARDQLGIGDATDSTLTSVDTPMLMHHC